MSAAPLAHRALVFAKWAGARGAVDLVFALLCFWGLQSAVVAGAESPLARFGDDWGFYEIFALICGHLFVMMSWPPSLLSLTLLFAWCGGWAFVFALVSPEPATTFGVLLGIFALRVWAYTRPRSEAMRMQEFAYTMLFFVPHVAVAVLAGFMILNWGELQAQFTHHNMLATALDQNAAIEAMNAMDRQRLALAAGGVFYLSTPWVQRWLERWVRPQEA